MDTTQPWADNALDLDKLEALAREVHQASSAIRAEWANSELRDELSTDKVLALIALARRAAQPVEAAVQQARNVAFEAAASLCDRFAARDMHPAECAGAIRMMKSALDKLAAAHPSEPAVPAVGCARLAHDGSEHPPKELRGFAGLIEVEYHNGSKERKKVGAIDWHRVVAYVAGPVGGALVSPGGVASEQIEKLALKHAAWRSTGPKFGVLFYADSLVRFVNDIAAPTGSAAAPADLTPTQERWLEIGQAVERACEFLPEGFDLHIELEHHAGSVRLYLRDDDASLDEFEADTFGGKINEAIDFATNQPIPTGEKA